MDYLKARHILLNKKLYAENRNLRYGYGKVRFHQYIHETMEHFLAKAIITKLILKKKHGCLTEHELSDGRTIDVLQVINKNNIIGYEVENSDYKKPDVKGIDIQVIDLRKLPDNVKKAFKTLENYFKDQII